MISLRAINRKSYCNLLEPQGKPGSPVELGLGGSNAEKAKNQNLLDHPACLESRRAVVKFIKVTTAVASGSDVAFYSARWLCWRDLQL